jgi:hypothetical protein
LTATFLTATYQRRRLRDVHGVHGGIKNVVGAVMKSPSVCRPSDVAVKNAVVAVNEVAVQNVAVQNVAVKTAVDAV